jgi:hypothetical protein
MQSYLCFLTASQLTSESAQPLKSASRTNELPSLEKRLPLDDEAYKTAVQPLEPLKGHIKELSGAEEVAQKLRQSILEPFRFLEMEISVLTDDEGLHPRNGYRQCTPDPMFNRRGYGQGCVSNLAGLLGLYKDQDSAISGDARIIDVESEPGKSSHNSEKDKTEFGIEFPLVSDNYSLDYYNDPCLFGEAHSLEYYLNVRSPSVPCQSPVAQPVHIPQNTNASSPSPMVA